MDINVSIRASVTDDWQVPSDTYVHCQVEVTSNLLDEPGELLDWLIGFGFDALHARVLDVRVIHANTFPSAPHH